LDDLLTFISDTHIGPNKYFGLDIIVEAFKVAIDYASETEFKTLIHCGDLFEKRMVGPQDLDAFAEIYRYARQSDVDLIVIDGNHGRDKSGSSVIGHYSVLSPGGLDVIVSEPEVKMIGYAAVLFCPFGVNILDSLDLLDGIESVIKVLVAHSDVVGCDYGNAISSTGLSKEDILRVLEVCDAVVLGHVHKPQQLYELPNVAFVGAPCQFNFGSAFQERGFLQLDMDTCELKFKEWTKGPKFMKFESLSEITDDALENAFVKSTIAVGEDVEETKERLLDLGANKKWLSVVEERIVTAVKRKSNMTIRDDPEKLALKFLDMKNVDGERRKQLMRVHKELQADMV